MSVTRPCFTTPDLQDQDQFFALRPVSSYDRWSRNRSLFSCWVVTLTHPTLQKISPKFVHNFFCYPPNRQTHKGKNTSSFTRGKYFILTQNVQMVVHTFHPVELLPVPLSWKYGTFLIIQSYIWESVIRFSAVLSIAFPMRSAYDMLPHALRRDHGFFADGPTGLAPVSTLYACTDTAKLLVGLRSSSLLLWLPCQVYALLRSTGLKSENSFIVWNTTNSSVNSLSLIKLTNILNGIVSDHKS